MVRMRSRVQIPVAAPFETISEGNVGGKPKRSLLFYFILGRERRERVREAGERVLAPDMVDLSERGLADLSLEERERGRFLGFLVARAAS